MNNNNDDLQLCESCGQNFDISVMSCDDDANWFCPECIAVLQPILKAEYDQMKANGDLDDE